MLIHIDEVQQGDRLITDAFNRFGVPLLKQGTILSLEDITLLMRHRLEYIDIEHIMLPTGNMTTAITNSSSLPDVLRQSIEMSLQTYQSLFLESLTRGRFSAELTDRLLDPLLLDLNHKKDVVSLLLMLEAEDDHIYSHSLKVGLLSYYIASWLGHNEAECYRISRAGYLHDIGKSRLPSIIRNGRTSMNLSQLKEYRKHTQYGYELIMNSLNDKATALVALQHHERGDGSGYPQRLYKNGIHTYTHIVAVADEFTNMAVVNEDGSKQGFIRILQNLYELGFSKLHEQPVQALIYHMSPNLVGKQVELDNGQHGTIVLANQTDLFRPLVQIDEQFIDLAKQRQVNIRKVFV
ncbi:HD-GYP domain-containing protein [Paenibacillus campi]|uniref:HD-GYP domain-containing protein n=1 Tax=Paenibacillus campi TaxID=3106031 RepID=UPI002AFEAF75|nr:HD domain-containing phosphohydrolase [Paenibacillus sp. SGZ-1014]